MSFKVWDEAKTNDTLVSTTDFNDITNQRNVGFQSGTLISSTFMNSILRQNSLFTTAFLEMLNDNGIDTTGLNFTSTINELKTVLANALPKKLYRHHFRIWLKGLNSNMSYPSIYIDIINQNNKFIITNAAPTNYPYTASDFYTSVVNNKIANSLLELGSNFSANGIYRLLNTGSSTVGKSYTTTNGLVDSNTSISNDYVIAFESFELSNLESTSGFPGSKYLVIYGNDAQSMPTPSEVIDGIFVQPDLVQEVISEI